MSVVFRPTARLLLQSSKRILSGTPTVNPTHTKFRAAINALPIEVYPLGVVILFGSSFGIYHMAKAFWRGTGRGEFRRHKAMPHELDVWET